MGIKPLTEKEKRHLIFMRKRHAKRELKSERTRTASLLRNERAKNRRKDEEIRLLRDIVEKEVEARRYESNGNEFHALSLARAALAEFDRGSK